MVKKEVPLHNLVAVVNYLAGVADILLLEGNSRNKDKGKTTRRRVRIEGKNERERRNRKDRSIFKYRGTFSEMKSRRKIKKFFFSLWKKKQV